MNKPNLFDFATSELSQDAFIAWLLTWANKEYVEIDNNLHACAVHFVRKLLKKDDYIVEKVKVDTQWKHTDVSAEINGEYFLLIEDKTATNEHSNNLKYIEMAKNYYQNTNFKVVPIYFKMEVQSNYSALEKVGYDIFTRQKMLPILEKYSVALNQNEILSDYYRHLKKLDKNENSYKTLPLNEWSKDKTHLWKGFFSAVQRKIDGNWGIKIKNRAGGSLRFWWKESNHQLDNKNFKICLHLKRNELLFFAEIEQKEDCNKVRDRYREFLLKAAEEKNVQVKLCQGCGLQMVVAKLTKDYRIPKEDGTIDLHATIENLKKIERLIDTVAEHL